MLDIKKIRNNPEFYQKKLDERNANVDLSEVLELDEKRKEIIVDVENKKAYRNQVSKKIPAYKKEGKDIEQLLAEMKNLAEEIKQQDISLKEIEDAITNRLLSIPNICSDLVKVGKDDSENEEIRKYGEIPHFDFDIKAHWDLGVDLEILDFERAGKITGSRFSIFKGKGARLERALINFMLDVHLEQGYTEINPPAMVKSKSMQSTGQLPKFKEDAFKVEMDDMYLVPTAEVPVTNYYRDEIIDFEKYPVHFTAYTPCFRREAGSAGRDTRGLIRNHQFDKVEMVKFAKAEDSYEELEKMTNDAEEILKRLNIPYRVVRLCSGDIGFASAMTYDIEVWMPSYNRYVEISSCSNIEDFQARRANIRYRNDENKLRYAHTLNGSGLAVGRTFAAVLENYQNEDGSISIPECLKPYLPFDKIER